MVGMPVGAGHALASPAQSVRSTNNGIDTFAVSNDQPVGDPVPGDVVHEWFVDAHAVYPSGPGHQPVNGVAYSEATYRISDDGVYVVLESFYGELSGAGVTYAADTSLTAAHVHARVPELVCDEVGCTPGAGFRDVDVTWTGVGKVTHSRVSSHFGGDALLSTYHSEGDERAATATGLPGTVLDAQMFNGRTAFHFVTKP